MTPSSYRFFRLSTLKKASALIVAALLLVSCDSKQPNHAAVHRESGQITAEQSTDAVALADDAVSRLNWPPISSINAGSATQRIDQQQAALRAKLDRLKNLGINTVFFQVKPDGTALWKSDIHRGPTS